ncbi:MAG: hypothetical protein JXR07_10890 [Reichenbachiella sp.]
MRPAIFKEYFEIPNYIAWNDWNPALGNYEVVIQNTNNIHNPEIKWPTRIEKVLEDYVNSGCGLYILHSANNAFPHWSEYNLMIGLGWRSQNDGIAIHINENGELAEIPIGEAGCVVIPCQPATQLERVTNLENHRVQKITPISAIDESILLLTASFDVILKYRIFIALGNIFF